MSFDHFYFCGHHVYRDGRFFCARSGQKILKSLTKRGIEFLICKVSEIDNPLEVAEYHLNRAIELTLSEIGNSPDDEDENMLLILMKKALALNIQTQWRRLEHHTGFTIQSPK